MNQYEESQETEEFGEEQDYKERDLSLKRMIEQARVRETNRPSNFNNMFLNTNFDVNDPYYIAPHLIPEGMKYFWARESDGEKRDIGRTNYLINLGYMPVPASRHPELMDLHELERSGGDTYIRRNGLLLMEVPAKREQEIMALAQARTDALESGIAEIEGENWSPVKDRRQREANRRAGILDHGQPY